MKKLKFALVLLTAIAFLPSCSSASINPIHKVYAETIAEQHKVTEEKWFYTYKIPSPQENETYIIDFYVFFAHSKSCSEWYCYKIDNTINCEMLWNRNL